MKKLLISLLVYTPLFGIVTISRNTPDAKPLIQTMAKKMAEDSEACNVHMPEMIMPSDRIEMTQNFAHKNIGEVFAEIYHSNYWCGSKSRSGQGSSLATTRIIRKELTVLCDALQINTLLDLGCGDYYWMRSVELKCDYIGADIVPEMIALNRTHYTDAKHHFLCLNCVEDPLPTADMVLCRDVIAHLNYEDACNLLRNIKASGSKFLLMTTHLDTTQNNEKHTGHHMAYNMTKAPFHLSSPLVLIEETSAETETREQRKAMGLWLIDDINIDCFEH